MDIDDNSVKQDVVVKGDDEEKNDLSITTERDYELMREALGEAYAALEAQEVPVGCVIVRNDKVIAKGQNMPNRTKDATTHAEFIAIDKVVEAEGDSCVFHDCDLYVTVEPCIMCASALLILGFRRVLFGCSNQRFGGCGSVIALCDKEKYGLHYKGYVCIAGLYSDEAIALLKKFYDTPNPHIPR
mmetsp:Transcript_6423/g.11124  ORF Transcript_6423/g.11124 Transcript_6423/m.11124 type:complete len:186 (-) Transcript_6423:14-571(-)